MSGDDGVPTAAWLHHCGSLNAGAYDPTTSLGEHAVCSGCHCEVKHHTEVVAHFELIQTAVPSSGSGSDRGTLGR